MPVVPPVVPIVEAVLSREVPLQESTAPSEEFFVTYGKVDIDLETEIVHYSGGVRAVYGPSVLTADELFYDRKNQKGRARGQVKILDPEGVFQADNLEFELTPIEEGSSKLRFKFGSAQNVYMEFEGMKMRMDSFLAAPGPTSVDITMKNLFATPSRMSPPEFAIKVKELKLASGKSGRASRIGFDVFGKHLFSLPYYNFSLDRRVTGFRVPAVSFTRGSGLGISWGSTFLLNEQTSLTGKLNSLPKSLPSITLEVARTPINPEKFLGRLTTRNDLSDRFSDSYIDSILVTNPNREIRMLRMPRNTTSAGMYYNQTTRGRVDDSETITKQLDVAFEIGGGLGRYGGFLSQVRAQSIRPDAKADFTGRLVTLGSAHSGIVPLTKGFGIMSRVDWQGTGSERTRFGWLRSSLTMVATPTSQFTLAFGATATLSAGRAEYGFDEIPVKRGLFGRADADLGSITLTALAKYDADTRTFPDIEYGFSFAAGSFRPYFNYRQFPREVQFGIKLRATDLFDRLSDRKFTRKSEPQKGTR